LRTTLDKNYFFITRHHPRVVYNYSRNSLDLLHTSQIMQIGKQQKLYAFRLAK